MKLIYIVLDGMCDRPIRELEDQTPLEAANTSNMNFLVKTGKTGLMYTVGKGLAPESDNACSLNACVLRFRSAYRV